MASRSGSTRLNEILSTVPLATLLFTGICLGLYVYSGILEQPTNEFVLGALPVITKLQLYRIVTAAFFHGGLMHVAMNMFSFFALGSSLVSPAVLRTT